MENAGVVLMARTLDFQSKCSRFESEYPHQLKPHQVVRLVNETLLINKINEKIPYSRIINKETIHNVLHLFH